MVNQFPAQQSSELGDEIDILELWKIFWREKYLIICATAGFAITSVIYSLQLTDIFQAEALLSPSIESGGSQIPGQLGLAANLAGVSFSQSNSNTINAMAILRSREFINKFVADHELLPYLFASEYDSSIGSSIIDTALYDLESGTWMMANESIPPTDGEAFKLFSEIFTLSEDVNTGLVTIAIEWPDPVLAAQWVNWLIADINAHVKAGDMKEARLAIDYLQRQLESTQLVEMQRVFYQLIESQTRTLMLADIRIGYVFEVIDPAVVPETKSKPRRALICIIGTLLGGVLSILYVLMRHYITSIGQQKHA